MTDIPIAIDLSGTFVKAQQSDLWDLREILRGLSADLGYDPQLDPSNEFSWAFHDATYDHTHTEIPQKPLSQCRQLSHISILAPLSRSCTGHASHWFFLGNFISTAYPYVFRRRLERYNRGQPHGIYHRLLPLGGLRLPLKSIYQRCMTTNYSASVSTESHKCRFQHSVSILHHPYSVQPRCPMTQ